MKNAITKALLVVAIAAPLCLKAQNPVFDWSHNIGKAGGGHNAAPNNSVTDAAGNVYTTGYYADTTDFDPGPGTTLLTTRVMGRRCMFVTKTAPNGSLIWAKGIDGSDHVTGNAIAVGVNDSVYVTGGFMGTADFDPGAGVENRSSAGSNDYFRLRLDPAGNFVSVGAGGGPGNDYGRAIHADLSGNSYVVYELGGSTSSDLAIIKYTSGVFAWSSQIQGSGYIFGGYTMASDASGNVYITGLFQGTKDFDGGAGLSELTSPGAGDYDMFILKLTSTGTFGWVKRVGGLENQRGFGINVDPLGNILVVGTFIGTDIDFDPGSGTTNLTTSVLNDDGYVLKLNSAGDFVWVRHISSPNPLTAISVKSDADGNVYVAGDYLTEYSIPGASSGPHAGVSAVNDVYIVKMSATGSLLWNGALNNIGSTSQNNVSNLAISNNGEVYAHCRFTGSIDSDPGVGINTLTSTGPGANIAMVKLKQCALSDAVTLSGTTITATMAGATYQWIDCAGNTPVSGATSQAFTPSVSGNYAVVVSSGVCSDTSVCTNVLITVSVSDVTSATTISVVPNPAQNGQFTLYVAAPASGTISAYLTDMLGRQVWKGSTNANTPCVVNAPGAPAGVYMLHTVCGDRHYTTKVLLN